MFPIVFIYTEHIPSSNSNSMDASKALMSSWPTSSTGAMHSSIKSTTDGGQPETARSISTHCLALARDGSSRFLLVNRRIRSNRRYGGGAGEARGVDRQL